MATATVVATKIEPQKNDQQDKGGVGKWKQRKLSVVSNSQTIKSEDEPKSPNPMFRRRSTFKGIATGILSMKRISLKANDLEDSKPKIRMENTYKTDPDEGKEFKSGQVEKVVNELLERELMNEQYDKDECKKMACFLPVLIKNQIKSIGLPRYKIICNVVIGQCMDQGVEMASQCIWNPSTDNFACCSYKNESLFVIALVHAVYFE